MSDKEFLKWIHDRLEYVHGDNSSEHHMHRLRAMAYDVPDNSISPNISWTGDSIIKIDYVNNATSNT